MKIGKKKLKEYQQLIQAHKDDDKFNFYEYLDMKYLTTNEGIFENDNFDTLNLSALDPSIHFLSDNFNAYVLKKSESYSYPEGWSFLTHLLDASKSSTIHFQFQSNTPSAKNRVLGSHDNFFSKIVEHKILTDKNIDFLLNTIHNRRELETFIMNPKLIERCLSSYCLTHQHVDHLDSIARNTRYVHHFNVFGEVESQNFFNYLRTALTSENSYLSKLPNVKDLQVLLETNEALYSLKNSKLTKEQQVEIVEILKNNETARNTLKSIVEVDLLDQYDFEQLKNVLSKDDNKKKIKMNF